MQQTNYEQIKANKILLEHISIIEPNNGGKYTLETFEKAKKCSLVQVESLLTATSKEEQMKYTNGEYSRSVHVIYDEFWVNVKFILLDFVYGE